MSESVKPRFAIDLNEIEKQLGQQAQPAPAPTRNDPLAELARIVGQDDPFQSLLAGDRSSRPAPPEPSLDDLFVTRDSAAAPRTAGLRSTFEPEDRPAHDSYDQLGASYADYQAKVEAEGQYDPQFPASFDDGAFDQGFAAPVQPPKRRSRKLAVTAAAVVGVAILGLGGVLMLNSPATMIAGGGEPPLIKATNEPSKVQPQSPGGVEIPNQNKQIYERASRDTQTKVVNREEQPVDVRQAARAIPSDAGGAARPQATATLPAGNGLNLGEPRKVRTVSIRPDGTVASADMPVAPSRPPEPAAVAPTAPATLSLPPAAQATPSATPAQPRVMPALAPTPAAPAATTPAPRSMAATPATPTMGGASPQQAPAAPAPTPTPQRVASAQPMPVAPTPALAPAPTAPATAVASLPDAGATGGWAVQLGVSPSEGDARSTLQRLQQKFADLDGATPLIRKAEVNGNTIYRIRVGPMGREEASSLCSKIQGQGGQCFATRN